MIEEKKAMKEKKDKKIAKKSKETQNKTKKIQNKVKETEKKVKKAKVAKGVAKKIIKVEKDKGLKKKVKETETEKKAQEAKKKAQEEMRKRAREEEKKFREAEKRIREAEKKAREAEITRVQEVEKKARESEMKRVQQAKKKAQEAELKKVQEEKKKAKEVEIKTKEEMKTMEEEKKPMEDEKKAKEVKAKTKKVEKKPVEEQRAPIEAPTDFSAPKNNNGRTAVFISLIALAVAFFNFFTPPASAPTKNVDLGGIQDNIDAVSSSVKNMKSKIAENRKLLDSQIASSEKKFEKQKAEADKMYLASGFTELVKDIQPSLGIYCKRASVQYLKLAKTAKAGANTVAVDCTFDNNGTLKANIIPGSLIMIGGKGQKVIDNAVERIDNGEATTILPGTSNGKQYHIVLTEAGTSNMKGGVLKMSFQAYTDKAALGMIKRKTHKEISEEQLKELTKKNHMFSFLL